MIVGLTDSLMFTNDVFGTVRRIETDGKIFFLRT